MVMSIRFACGVLLALAPCLTFAPAPALAALPAQAITVTLADEASGVDISPSFLGLSFESSSLLPANGHYYFDPADKPLVQTFRTLGVKNIRVGAAAVDNPQDSHSAGKRHRRAFRLRPGGRIEGDLLLSPQGGKSGRLRATRRLHRGARLRCTRGFFRRQRTELLLQDLHRFSSPMESSVRRHPAGRSEGQVRRAQQLRARELHPGCGEGYFSARSPGHGE